MCTPTQLDYDSFRILLYRNDAAELLAEAQPDGLRLPLLSVPAHARVAEEITAAIKSAWNLETYCLFPLSIACSSPAQDLRYQVVEIWGDDRGAPAGMQWVPLAALSADAFEDSTAYEAVARSLADLDRYRHSELSGAFGRLGSLRELTTWVESQAASAGLGLTGKFRQLSASPTFSLIRFETNGRALWFKAVGEPNRHEYPITLKLATSFPEFVPHILGSHPKWNGWLALEAEGAPLEAGSPQDAWEAAAENLARLQVSSLGRGFEFIEAGCKDLRPSTLMTFVDPFFDAMADLMARQTKLSPAPLDPVNLLALGRTVAAALTDLEDAGVSSTLGHLDLNPGNMLVDKERCVFLDWAEAYVGSPFFSFQYLLQHRRRLHRADAERSMVACYAKIWSRFASMEQIATSLKLAPLLAAFAYGAAGINWQNTGCVSTGSAAYLRSLVRCMKREADVFSKARPVCAL
jgi:Phosphotransferase enzyme family